MSKNSFFLVTLILLAHHVCGQTVGSIIVKGDLDKFYPVLWTDGGWTNNAASVLEIGRSDVHGDAGWRGSLIASFKFHLERWGNGAKFIDADIMQVNNKNTQNYDFIAGWRDGTGINASMNMVLWMRGGGTTYHFKSVFPTTAVVYDGVANPLPYQEVNGPALTFKTVADLYVNSNGISKAASAYFLGGSPNYFEGNVGLGTVSPKERLSVNGKIRAHEIKVETANWPDYVFAKDYQLPSLKETEQHIKEKGHLPGIPSAEEVKTNGVDLGEMNAKLLKKIEELTLHLIQKGNELDTQKNMLAEQQIILKKQQKKLDDLEQRIK
jgi:hypothetical protein